MGDLAEQQDNNQEEHSVVLQHCDNKYYRIVLDYTLIC